ncbi:Gamma-aminobutyric acid receptor subunit gamma-3 [Pelomyxa schiedti]|nr:Gamma-aminobutyric acid receptor subunit gamma-3 [Pelomyxa schiedti]
MHCASTVSVASTHNGDFETTPLLHSGDCSTHPTMQSAASDSAAYNTTRFSPPLGRNHMPQTQSFGVGSEIQLGLLVQGQDRHQNLTSISSSSITSTAKKNTPISTSTSTSTSTSEWPAFNSDYDMKCYSTWQVFLRPILTPEVGAARPVENKASAAAIPSNRDGNNSTVSDTTQTTTTSSSSTTDLNTTTSTTISNNTSVPVEALNLGSSQNTAPLIEDDTEEYENLDETLDMIGLVAGLPTTTMRSGSNFDVLSCCSKEMYAHGTHFSGDSLIPRNVDISENESTTVKFSLSESWEYFLGFYKCGAAIRFGGGVAMETPESDIRVHISSDTKQGYVVSFESSLFPGTWVAAPTLSASEEKSPSIPLCTTQDHSQRAFFYISLCDNRKKLEDSRNTIRKLKKWLIPALQFADIPLEKSMVFRALTKMDIYKWALPLDTVLALPHRLRAPKKTETQTFLYALEFLDVKPGQSLLQVNVGTGKIAQILCHLLRDDSCSFRYTGWDIDACLNSWINTSYKENFDRILLRGKAPQGRYYQIASLLKPGGILVGSFETLSGGKLFQVRKALDGTLSRTIIPVYDGIQMEIRNLLAPPVIAEIKDRVTLEVAQFAGDLDDEEELRQWLCYFGDAYNMNLSKYASIILSNGYPLPLIREGGIAVEDLTQLGIPMCDATGLAFAVSKYAKFMEDRAEASSSDTKKKVKAIDISVVKTLVNLLRVDSVLSEFEVILELTLHYHDYIQWRALMAKEIFGTVEQPISVQELSIAPMLTFPNSKSPVTLISESASIVPQTGMVDHSFVFSGVFLEIMELQRFPFDRQVLHIEMAHDRKHQQNISVTWRELPTKNPNEDDLAMISHDREWEEAHVSIYYPRDTKSNLVIAGRVQRYSSYFMWNVVFVMLLIVSMSFLTWALAPEEGGDRLSLNLTLLLTSVAYKYVIASYLPKTAYLTILDLYVLSSFVLLVFVIIENAIAALCDSPANRNLDKISAIILVTTWLSINALMVLGCMFGFFRLPWCQVDSQQVIMSAKKTKFLGFLSRSKAFLSPFNQQQEQEQEQTP